MPVCSWVPSYQPIAYNAIGAAYSTTSGGSTISGSWTHTASAGADVFVAVVTVSSGGISSVTAYTRSATYGGATMTSLGAANPQISGSYYGWTELFHLARVPGGAQTVSISASGGSGTIDQTIANSVSYLHVGPLSSAITNSGTTTSMSSGSIPSATGQLVVQVFGAGGYTESASGYNQTTRYSNSLTGGAADCDIILGDAPGASTVSFAATTSGSTYQWSSVAVSCR